MTTPPSVVFTDNGAIDRHPFLYGRRGTTFVQSQSYPSRQQTPRSCSGSTTVESIEHGAGEWKDVPLCVRDTILRLLKSADEQPLVVNSRSASTQPVRVSSRPPSARGDRSASTNRVSFIASEGLPPRRRTPLSTRPARNTGGGPAQQSALRETEATTVSAHLSPMVERVLARSSQQSPPRAAVSPVRGTHATIAPTKAQSNSPFGAHPYETPEKSREPVHERAGPKRTVSPRRSPVRNPTQHGAWKPAGAIQAYEPTEPFGTNAADGRTTKTSKSLRALALSNLMTFHNGVDRMKTDHESLLAGQLMTAMQQGGRRAGLTHPLPTTTSPHEQATPKPLHQGPTEGQRKALDDVGFLLRALHEASIELVAQFASDEEKRFLGLHSHKYQTRAERQSSYQYTAVDRKLRMSTEGHASGGLPKTGSYSQHLAQEASYQQCRSVGSASFGPSAHPGDSNCPPPRLPSKVMLSPLKSPRSAPPSVPQRHSSSSSLNKNQNVSTDFVTGAVDLRNVDDSESTLTSTIDESTRRPLPAAEVRAPQQALPASQSQQLSSRPRDVQPQVAKRVAQQPPQSAVALSQQPPSQESGKPVQKPQEVVSHTSTPVVNTPSAAVAPAAGVHMVKKMVPAPTVAKVALVPAAAAKRIITPHSATPTTTVSSSQPARTVSPTGSAPVAIVPTSATNQPAQEGPLVARAVSPSERGTSVCSQATTATSRRRFVDISHLRVKDSDDDSDDD
jgi:hypothetical protein